MDYEKKLLKERIEELYWEQNMSSYDVSKELGIPQTSLLHYFKILRIKTRNRKQAAKLMWKNHRYQETTKWRKSHQSS